MPSTTKLVVHVLPDDVRRGAQTHARALRDLLDAPDVSHRTLTIFAGPDGPLDPDVSLDVRGGALRRFGFHPGAARRLRRALRQLAPDVVVAHGGEPLKYAAIAMPRSAVLVYHRIGTGATLLARWSSTLVQRLALSRVTAAAAVSEAAGAELASYRPGLAITVIPNGRDPGRYHPPADGRDGTPPTVVFLGHLTASKRPLLFLDVVRELAHDGLALAATIVGDGPLLEDVRRAAGSVVTVTGARGDVERVLQDADVLVMTSLPTGEGMPGVLIEASLAGLPIVTTDVPGAREVVVDGVTGFVVGIDDRDLLTERVRTLVDDAGLRAEMGAAGRARALARFTLATSAEGWASFLAGVIRQDA